MPELGGCDRRGIASLGGLAPKARESGKWRGQRRIGGGRRQVRRALYMAAISALRHGSFCAAFMQGLRDKGKPGKVMANSVLHDQTPFEALS